MKKTTNKQRESEIRKAVQVVRDSLHILDAVGNEAETEGGTGGDADEENTPSRKD